MVEIVEGALYAIHWDGESEHALDIMALQLSDAEYLYDYFEANADKLLYFRCTVERAVEKTSQEGVYLIEQLYKWAEQGLAGKKPDLDDLFEPLHKNQVYGHRRFYTDFKAKGDYSLAPWIRVYAVRCDENLYVITGHGIKLVRRMQDDPDLQVELKKLAAATDYLKSIGML